MSNSNNKNDDVFPFGFPFLGRHGGANMFNSFFSSRSRGEWIPPVDIAEGDNSYALTADLPEMTKDDVRVYTEGDTAICISGTRRHVGQVSDRPLIVAERGVGRFERCFDLPTKLDESKVKASFKDGQLSVEIPKLRSSRSGSGNSIKIE